MARSRNIKPAFFDNDELAGCDPLARLLFIGLWCLADYNGNLEYRPAKIKKQLLGYDDCDIESLVTSLDKSRFITIYHDKKCPNIKYINITNFSAHQRPHPNEKKAGTKIPLPIDVGSQPIDLQGVVTNHDHGGINHEEDAPNPPDSCFLIPDSCSPDKDLCPKKESDELDKQTQIELAEAKAKDQKEYIDALFDKFWLAGMKKQDKKKARVAFDRVIKAEPDKETFVDSLVLDIQKRLSLEQLGFDKLHPTTYLNGERWEDDYAEIQSTGSGNNGARKQTGAEISQHLRDRIAARSGGNGIAQNEFDGQVVATYE